MSLFLIVFFTGVGLMLAAVIQAVTIKNIPMDSDWPIDPADSKELQQYRDAVDKCAIRLRITATVVIIASIVGVFPAVGMYQDHIHAIRQEERRKALDEIAEEMLSSTVTPRMQDYFKTKYQLINQENQ